MKALVVVLTCLVGVGGSSAQDVSDKRTPPGVVFLKLKWSRDVQLPRGWDRMPMGASASGLPSDLSAERDRGGVGPSGRPLPTGGGRRFVYDYSAEIRNDGAKEMKGFIWEYIVSDPGSGKELGRHRFYSYKKVSANKKATLRGRSRNAPSKVVSAAGLEKDKRSPFDERVEIRCVMYADGSWWMHPSVRESECLNLKRREKLYKRMNSR